MIAEFIKPDDPRWMQALLRSRYDFYHLPEYVAFAAKHEGGTPVAFYAEEGETAFLIPMLVRDIPAQLEAPGDWRDATSPYGYPGPLIAGDPALLSSFLEVFRELGREYGIVNAFIRLHPLLDIPLAPLVRHGDLVHHGQTVYIDLSRSQDDIRSQMRRNHRTHVKKMEQSGFRAVINDWSQYDDFMRIYNETMERVSASQFYRFSREYFMDFREALGDKLHLCTVISPDGDIASVGIFTTVGGISQSHLGGTHNEYISVAPSKFQNLYECFQAKDEGCYAYHLGGGVGGTSEDPLFQFKAGFSKLRAEFYTYRMVLDKKKHSELTRLWKTLCGPLAQSDTHFFPVYRKRCA